MGVAITRRTPGLQVPHPTRLQSLAAARPGPGTDAGLAGSQRAAQPELPLHLIAEDADVCAAAEAACQEQLGAWLAVNAPGVEAGLLLQCMLRSAPGRHSIDVAAHDSSDRPARMQARRQACCCKMHCCDVSSSHSQPSAHTSLGVGAHDSPLYHFLTWDMQLGTQQLLSEAAGSANACPIGWCRLVRGTGEAGVPADSLPAQLAPLVQQLGNDRTSSAASSSLCAAVAPFALQCAAQHGLLVLVPGFDCHMVVAVEHALRVMTCYIGPLPSSPLEASQQVHHGLMQAAQAAADAGRAGRDPAGAQGLAALQEPLGQQRRGAGSLGACEAEAPGEPALSQPLGQLGPGASTLESFLSPEQHTPAGPQTAAPLGRQEGGISNPGTPGAPPAGRAAGTSSAPAALPQQIRQPLRPWLDHWGAVNQPLWQALLQIIASLLMARPGECGLRLQHLTWGDSLHAELTAESLQRCCHAFLPDSGPWHCNLPTKLG